jgi:hypothetical protein
MTTFVTVRITSRAHPRVPMDDATWLALRRRLSALGHETRDGALLVTFPASLDGAVSDVRHALELDARSRGPADHFDIVSLDDRPHPR